ncbi:Nucleotide binding protein, containing PIN domain [Thermococcus guaymasensis DSM 11113]|uniref:Nucleotide binding protein, containing PIN domain n=1 Tax=Thermococcus guaymasensis DSM 11113 TaxID=1432656 RepID=A0A0X1KL69_9EURY|nr:PIN domain-containing protein [Thermococcus guaymasensis]AJC72012.1 Nucleotide binding protein, containing PIN domain [Thermococcus guaymasensis DSM 11113]
MRRSSTASKFLIDTNVFIAAVKRGWTDTTELLLHILSDEKYHIVGNDVLLAEYRKYVKKLSVEDFYEFLKLRMEIVNPSREEVLRALPYFPPTQIADAVHAATCLKTGAILITNDRHFEKVAEKGLIKVWSISDAIRKILRR